jgi:effector-binding domain-containing protein
MKFLKTLGVLLIFIIAIGTILMLVLPVRQKIERSTLINAKAPVVYEYLSKLANFNKWSAWNQQDTSIINTITGMDGTLGAINNWKGDPELSGEGKMQITSLEINQEIEHHITFLSPRKMDASSEFDLHEVNGQTKVIWTFEMETPRPWNIFNLFSSMDKQMGKDFERGLMNLKADIEKKGNIAKEKTYDVLPMNFPSTSFATRRQILKWAEMPMYFEQNLPQIFEQSMQSKAVTGSPTGLFYFWDEANQQADMAAAIPVMQGTSFGDTTIQVVNIPGSKAIYVDYYGPYDNFSPAYASLDQYLANNNLKKKLPSIEQYITDPKVEKDNSKWLTRIIFLVE